MDATEDQPTSAKDYLPVRNQCYTPYAGDYHDAILITNQVINNCLDDYENVCKNHKNCGTKIDDSPVRSGISPEPSTTNTPAPLPENHHTYKCNSTEDALNCCLKGRIFVNYTKQLVNFNANGKTVHGTYDFDNLGDSSAGYAFFDVSYYTGSEGEDENEYPDGRKSFHIYDNANNSKFKKVAFYDSLNEPNITIINELQLLGNEDGSSIDWPGKKVPLNEPMCGYDGSLCKNGRKYF